MDFNGNQSICFWSWNANISEDGIQKQLQMFADGRIEGVVIHARAGLRVPYLSEEWMRLVAFAVSKAAEYHLEVWIYDEQGWPSGFASGAIPKFGDDYCHKNLRYARKGEFVGQQIRMDTVLAVYVPSDENYRLSDCRDITKWPQETLVFWVEKDSHYVDLLNPDVTNRFIQTVHEKYYQVLGTYFGTTVKGFFTDEPQLNNYGYPWSTYLKDAYFQKTGKLLLDDLWLLATDDIGYSKVRTDFWNTVSDLYFHSYTEKIANWCEAHRVSLTGHFAMEDGLCGQISSNGGVMRHYRAMQLPGIDHLGSRVASPVLMKQVSSVSRQFGNGNVLSETFGCTGWGVSFRRLEWIWGGQSVLGITKPCYHLAAYSMEGSRKRDYPAFFSSQELWWDDFRFFASRMKNINQMMAEGKRELQTLVISPLQSVRALYADKSHNQEKINHISAQFRMLTENLLDLQLDFDLADSEQFIESAVFEDEQITLGNISYKTLFLSYSPIISEAMNQKLQSFSQSGLQIFVIGEMPRVLLPDGKMGFSDFGGTVIVNRRDTLEKFLEFEHIARPAVLLDSDSLKPVSGVRLHVRQTRSGKRVHIWPKEDFPGGEFMLYLNDGGTPYSIDAFTCCKTPLPTVRTKDGLMARVTVRKQESLFVEVEDEWRNLDFPRDFQWQQPVQQVEVSLCEPNCLTLDYARLSFDEGKTFGEEIPVVKALHRIYEHCNGCRKTIVMKYTFFCSDIPEGEVSLAFEDCEYQSAIINGTPLPKTAKGRWIDDSIGEYDITGHLVLGENHFLLTYVISGRMPDKNLQDIFETEKNRFFYPIEPDSVYVRGNFDIVPRGEVISNGYAWQTSQFSITKPTQKKIGDLTSAGAWFYRGNARYRIGGIKPSAGKRTFLAIDGYDGALVKIWVNGKEYRSSSFVPEFDLTDELKNSDNEVTVELVGTNRNLLGPHHHICGELSLIGPATFEGRHEELTDFMVPSVWRQSLWTDDYGFIPFGIHKIFLKLR